LTAGWAQVRIVGSDIKMPANKNAMT